jgi:penicillin amidase
MVPEWPAYGKDAQHTSARFVAGINAYIDTIARKPELMPSSSASSAISPRSGNPKMWSASAVMG